MARLRIEPVKLLPSLLISLLIFSCFMTFVPEIYANDESWSSKKSMPTARSSLAVSVDNKIYAIGGWVYKDGKYTVTSLVEVYDTQTDSLENGKPLTVASGLVGAVAIGRKIYVLIGETSQFFVFDINKNEWMELARLPADANTGSFGMNVVGGKIYVARGSADYPSGIYWTYCYDPQTNSWTKKSPIPYHRTIESLAELNGKLYAIGGADPSLGRRIEVTRVDIYDPETDTWTLDATKRMFTPRTHLEPDTPVVNGKIYVIGGWDGYSTLSTVEEYDPATNSWKTLTPMPTARYGLATAVVNGKIYCIGGDSGGYGGNPKTANEELSISINPPYKVLHVSVFKQNELQKIIDSVGASALFTITQVSVDEFNRGNPSDLSVYDAIVFGINDWGEVAGNRDRKYDRLAELQNYVSNGGGIVWTHDTLEQWWDYGSQIEEPAGVDNYDIYDKNRERVWYSSVKIVEDHTILHQPYEIGNVGDIISVQYTHTNGGRIKTAKAIIKSHNGKYESQATNVNDFYLTVSEYGKGRVAIIEIGHSIIREDKPASVNVPSEKESKILVNTLYWVSSAEAILPGGYILHVQSYPITGIEISYAGDYSGSGRTNFDIGPKNSPFTVILAAPLTCQNYRFDHWELDGLVMDKSNLLTVEVSSMQNIRTAIAYYCQVILLSFSVTFENEEYDVLLHVPLSSFNESVKNFPSVYYRWFSSIDANILESALYIYRHVEHPNQYPILDIAIQKGGREIVDKDIKVKILNGLLQYCYELFFLTSPHMLDSYKSNGENWLKAHEDLRWTVFISDLVSGGLYYLTVIAPLIKNIKNLFGDDVSNQVESAIKLIYELVTQGNDGLVKKYGYEQARKITNILKSSGLISTADYNTMELYQNIIKDPIKSSQVICQIQNEVFGVKTDPKAQELITNFIQELLKSTIAGFSAGTALALYAYFGLGLTAKTAMQIGTYAMFKGFFGYTIPLALASAIHESYITPMAQSMHEAWEAMKQESDVYFDLHKYGQRIANPINNAFNLTNIQIFSSLQGIRCIIEFYYYMNCYFHTKGQFLNPKRDQEVAIMKEMADSALSQAKNWADMLEKIHGYARAVIEKVDPEGSAFSFTFQPPIIVFPVVPPNSSGFVLIANQTVNITMKCGQYYFIVQNREWFTNFTHSVYIDDPYGRIYMIIFNPPEGKYDVEAQNFTPLTLVKFVPSTDGVILSRIEEDTTTMSFEVSSGGEIKKVVLPWWIRHQFWIITGVIVIALLFIAIIVLRKVTHKYPPLPPPPPPNNYYSAEITTAAIQQLFMGMLAKIL